jgi:hypothetical protein
MKAIAILISAILFMVCSPTKNTEYSVTDISSAFVSPALGCSNFKIYTHDSNSARFLVIYGKTDSLKIDTVPKEFDLSACSANLDVFIDYYDYNNGTQVRTCFDYCNDVLCSDSEAGFTRWTAQEGKIKIWRSEITHTQFMNMYTVSVELNNVILKSTLSGENVQIKFLRIQNVTVGFLPG